MAEADRKRASGIAIPQPELQQPERECPRWPPSTLRSRERRAPGARRSSTWPCRNCGSSRPRPHRYGRHTSWHSPLTNRAAQNGELRSQNPQIPADFVGTVLLLGRGRIRVVGAARLFVGRTLWNGLLPGSGILFVFVQACLNFINHAQIADELGAVGINEMRLAVRLAINRGGIKIRQLRLAKRETRGRENDDESRGNGNRAVHKTRRPQPAQPALRAAPALGSESRRQNRIEKLWPRFNLRQSVQSAENMGNTGDQRSATLASVHMEVESGLLGGMKKSVEVIAQPRFGLFAIPVHGMLRARFETPNSIMTGALPSAAERAPVRSVPD